MKALTEWTCLPDPQFQVMSFLASHNVGAIIVSNDDPAGSVWRRWLPAAVAVPVEVGGVTLYRISPSAFLPYAAVTAREAERRANSALFEGLLRAAIKYRASGGDPRRLTPFAAEQLGLIPSAWLPGPVWVPAWIAGTKFDTTLDINRPIYRGVWLGWVDGTFLGIGIKGTYEGLQPIIDRYRPDAYRIYFPYPSRYSDSADSSDQGFLLMFFDAVGLERAIATGTKVALDSPSAQFSPHTPHP
jgi:hypothetical protein